VTWLIIVAIVAVVAVVVVVLLRSRASHSSVDSFRRQIDALGPEARRTVVDQVQTAAARGDEEQASAEPAESDDKSEGGDTHGA
jgi:FtsZ-interacting cell division protein ZipA